MTWRSNSLLLSARCQLRRPDSWLSQLNRLFRWQHQLTFQPGDADDKGSKNGADVDNYWREITQSATDDGIEDQYTVGAFQYSAEHGPSRIATLLIVNKRAERPGQHRDRRKQAAPLRAENRGGQRNQKDHRRGGHDACR